MQKRTFLKRNIISQHLSEYKLYYICIFIVFSLGILIGACTATSFDAGYTGEVNQYFSDFSESLKETKMTEMLRRVLLISIKEAVLIWVMGLMIFGCVPVLYLIFKRGFILGVTVTFILNAFGERGLVISTLLMLFGCILYMPVIFFLSAKSMNLSAVFLDKLILRANYGFDLKSVLSRYLLILILCIVAIILYALLESFVSFSVLKACFIT